MKTEQKFEKHIFLGTINYCKDTGKNIYEYYKENISIHPNFVFLIDYDEEELKNLNLGFLEYLENHYNFIPEMKWKT